jgi:hypothetical protein
MGRLMGANAAASYAPTATWASTGWSNSLKEFYDKNMSSLIMNQIDLLKYLKEKGRVQRIKPAGKFIKFFVDLYDVNSGGANNEDGYVASAGASNGIQGTVEWNRGFKGSIGLSLEAIKFGKQGEGGFVDMVKHESESLMRSIENQAAAAFWGDSIGILAKHSTASTVTVTLVQSETATACHPGARWLTEGMSIISCSNLLEADAQMIAAKNIVSINSDTSITMSDAASGTLEGTTAPYFVQHFATDSSSGSGGRANGSVILQATGGAAANPSFRGPQGLTALFDDGTLAPSVTNFTSTNIYNQGIDLTTYPQWKSYVSGNGGNARALSTDLFYRVYGVLSRRAQAKNLVCFMNFDVHREVVALMEPFLMYQARQLKPGYEEFDLMINGVNIPIKIDHRCPGYIFMFDPSCLTIAEASPLSIDDTAGQWRTVANKTNYEQYFNWTVQMYCTNRKKAAVIRDISYTGASL